jgi:hypothetical protein
MRPSLVRVAPPCAIPANELPATKKRWRAIQLDSSQSQRSRLNWDFDIAHRVRLLRYCGLIESVLDTVNTYLPMAFNKPPYYSYGTITRTIRTLCAIPANELPATKKRW